MPNYAIMRCEKLSSMGNVAASLSHNFRERDTPNADGSRTPLNTQMVATSTSREAIARMRAILPEKRRKDAVLAVEYIFTASPDWWKDANAQQQDDFFSRSMEWLERKYGSGRIFAATIHRDETTPHLAAYVVPLTADGRLSAKEFIGNRHQMSEDQTTYAEAVSHLGLVRGIPGSKAKHQRVQRFYGAVESAEIMHGNINPDDLTPRKLPPQKASEYIMPRRETAFDVAQRLNQAMHKHYEGVLATAVQTLQDERRANIDKERIARAMQVVMPLANSVTLLSQRDRDDLFEKFRKDADARWKLRLKEEERKKQLERAKRSEDARQRAMARQRALQERLGSTKNVRTKPVSFRVVGGEAALDRANGYVISIGGARTAEIGKYVGKSTLVVDAVDADNLCAVAEALRQRYPNKPIVIDGWNNESRAQQVATDVSGCEAVAISLTPSKYAILSTEVCATVAMAEARARQKMQQPEQPQYRPRAPRMSF